MSGGGGDFGPVRAPGRFERARYALAKFFRLA